MDQHEQAKPDLEVCVDRRIHSLYPRTQEALDWLRSHAEPALCEALAAAKQLDDDMWRLLGSARVHGLVVAISTNAEELIRTMKEIHDQREGHEQ